MALPDTTETVIYLHCEDGLVALPEDKPELEQTLEIGPCENVGVENCYFVQLRPRTLESGEVIPGGRQGGGLTFLGRGEPSDGSLCQ